MRYSRICTRQPRALTVRKWADAVVEAFGNSTKLDWSDSQLSKYPQHSIPNKRVALQWFLSIYSLIENLLVSHAQADHVRVAGAK
jgi:hypothetical protein